MPFRTHLGRVHARKTRFVGSFVDKARDNARDEDAMHVRRISLRNAAAARVVLSILLTAATARAVEVEFRLVPADDPEATVDSRGWDRPQYAPVSTARGVDLRVVGRDLGCWVRNLLLDDEPLFERYQDTRYIDRAPRVRRDLRPGVHTLWPGGQRVTVAADGALATTDAGLQIEGRVVRILAYPVTVRALLANPPEGPLPASMRVAPIPNLAVRDAADQAAFDASVAAWEAGDRSKGAPRSTVRELLPVFEEFAPLTLWLPLHTQGQGYLLHPLGFTFHVGPEGVTATQLAGEPPIAGIVTRGHAIEIPLYRFPVRGPRGSRLVVTGVEAYRFERAFQSVQYTQWYPRRKPYEVRVADDSAALLVAGDLTGLPFKSLAVDVPASPEGGQVAALVEHAERHLEPGRKAVFHVQAVAASGPTNRLAQARWQVVCEPFGGGPTGRLTVVAAPLPAGGQRLEITCPDVAAGIYELRFEACPPDGPPVPATVITRVTIARPAPQAVGLFTPRGRTAFFRGEQFWVGVGLQALGTPLAAGTEVALDLVDGSNAVLPLYRSRLDQAVPGRATRLLRLDGAQTLSLAAGHYRLQARLGATRSRTLAIDLVDPEPRTHFTSLITGKYNSHGAEYAALLQSGDRTAADRLVREMVAAGANGFKGMSYDFNRVARTDTDVEQLARERPELGPWEAWYQPSGRDRFLDACVRHNLRFWENLFTYNDCSLPRGARIRAGSGRYAGLETHSMRHSPAFQGVCLYDEIYARSGNDGTQVGNAFEQATELEYREQYDGRTGAQALKALDRFASRPFGQRDVADLDVYRTWAAWEDEMWNAWGRAIVRPVRDIAPTSRNFVLNRYWGGNGGNLAANGYEAGVFAELDIAACVMYKDGGYGDRPVFAPMQADVLRIRPDLPVWTQIHDFNGPGIYGQHLLRQAFLALGQKTDGFTFFCTSFSTQEPRQQDHQWSVANIARELCTPYGDFLLSLDKGYRQVAVYYSRTAAFLGARKPNSLEHQCEGLWVACLRAGFPADYLRDEDLLAGRAAGYRVIFVPGFTYEEECPPDLLAALKKLIASGATVLVEKSSRLPLEGVVRLNDELDEYNDKLGHAFPRYVDFETEVVFARTENLTRLVRETLPRYVAPAARHDLPFGPDWQVHGDAAYLFVANHTPVEFNGLHRTLYQAPVVAELEFPARPPICYDLLEMQRVAAPVTGGWMRVSADLRRSPGKILAFLPRPIGGVRLKAPASLTAGADLQYAVRVADADGRELNASFPVEITLTSPDGQVPYHVWRAAAPELRAAWRLPRNVPAGNWQLTVRELISGTTASLAIAVTAPKEAPAAATAEPPTAAWIQEPDRLRAFLAAPGGEIVVPLEADQPEVRAVAERLVAGLTRRGLRARLASVETDVRPPSAVDPRNPQLDGTRLWRGEPVQPAQFVDGPTIVLGRRDSNRLLATLIAREALNQAPSESFPGPGRGYLAWVRRAFSIDHDTVVVAGSDARALERAVDALLALAADTPGEPAMPRLVQAAVDPAATLAEGRASAPRVESFASHFAGNDMVMSIDFDPAAGRTLVGTFGYGTNLFCLGATGTLDWAVYLPEHNVYDARWYDGGRSVVALTGRGLFAFLLDGPTGQVRQRCAASEWPDLQYTEGSVDTRVSLTDNPTLRQLLISGRTGLLALGYDGTSQWFHDLTPEITTYPEEAEKSGGAAIFPRNATVGSAVLKPDGSEVALASYRIVGTTLVMNQLTDVWGFRPQVLDTRTGRVLCTSTNDPGVETSPTGWGLTWPADSPRPLVWRQGGDPLGRRVAAPILADGSFGPWAIRAESAALPGGDFLTRTSERLTRHSRDGLLGWQADTAFALPERDRTSDDQRFIYRIGWNGLLQQVALGDGRVAWQQPLGASALLRPVADGLLAGTLDGQVARLRLDGSLAWQIDLTRLQQLPARDYPAFVRAALLRDADRHRSVFPDDPERPGDFEGVLRFGIEHLVNGGFEQSGGWTSTLPVRLATPARQGARAMQLAAGQLATQAIDRRVIPLGTYLFEFFFRSTDPKARLVAGAELRDGAGAVRPTLTTFTGLPGQWTFGRLAIKTGVETRALTVGFEAVGGEVQIDDASLRPVRFPSANLLAYEPLHAIEPTFVRDIRVRYSRVPPELKQRIMARNRVSAYRQGGTDTGAIPLDEEAFLHNGRIDDCGSAWYFQPDAVGFSVALTQPTWVSHVVLYLNNATPSDVYPAIALQANDLNLKVPVTVALVRNNTRRFVVIDFPSPIQTDTLRVLPGVQPHSLRECLTEIEVYGPQGGPATNQVRGFTVDTNAWPMYMGGPAHVPRTPGRELLGTYQVAGSQSTYTPAWRVGGIAADGLFVFGSPDGALRSARLGDKGTGLSWGPRWSFGSLTPLTTPAWYSGRLLVGAVDGKLHALADNGRPLWSFRTEGRVYASPTPDGDEVYVGSDDGRLYRVDLDSGVLLWEFATGGPVRSAPAVAGGHVFAVSGDGRLHAVETESGRSRWTAPLAPHSRAAPAVAGGRVFVADEAGGAHGFDAATGRALWRVALGGRSSWGPAVTPMQVVFAGDGGRALAVSPDRGTAGWSRDLGCEITGQPFANATQFVVPTAKGVRVLRLADGADDPRFTLPANASGRTLSVVPYGNRLWVLTGNAGSTPGGNNTFFAWYDGTVQLWVPKE